MLDASLQPADASVWDYRPIFQKFLRYLSYLEFLHTFIPFVMDQINESAPTLREASFNNSTGIMILTTDSSTTFNLKRPDFHSLDTDSTFLRVDVQKRLLKDGSRKSAYDFSINCCKASSPTPKPLPLPRPIFNVPLFTNDHHQFSNFPVKMKKRNISVST